MSHNVKFKDLYMETPIDHTRKRKTSVPVYQFKITSGNKYNGDGSKKDSAVKQCQ